MSVPHGHARKGHAKQPFPPPSTSLLTRFSPLPPHPSTSSPTRFSPLTPSTSSPTRFSLPHSIHFLTDTLPPLTPSTSSPTRYSSPSPFLNGWYSH
eukprot:361415-Chlamydomonas_euryale.AAC.7